MKVSARWGLGFKMLWWWLALKGQSVSARLAAIHCAALAALSIAFLYGALTPILVHGGFVSWLILVVAGVNAIAGIAAAHRFEHEGDVTRARGAISWMEHADNIVLILGFLGTLQGAIIELTNVDPTATGAGMLLMLKNVLRGVGVAIYTTVAGAAAALWTSTATRLLSNVVEARAEAGPGYTVTAMDVVDSGFDDETKAKFWDDWSRECETSRGFGAIPQDAVFEDITKPEPVIDAATLISTHLRDADPVISGLFDDKGPTQRRG